MVAVWGNLRICERSGRPAFARQCVSSRGQPGGEANAMQFEVSESLSGELEVFR
jgi:hypothetical protein